ETVASALQQFQQLVALRLGHGGCRAENGLISAVMALRGIPREGAGGSGVAPFTLDEGPNISFIDSSIFGCGVTTNGRAIAACSVRQGVWHAPLDVDPGNPWHLYLATLTADGRGRTQQSGTFGRGIWFEAKGNERYAIGEQSGRFILVYNWGTGT